MKVYQHYFDDLLRTKAHILSAREEELLAMSGKATEASGDAFGLLSNTELRWRTVKDPENRDIEITSSSFSQAMQSKDRRYRHDAFLALHDSFLDVKSTLAATLAGAMQRDWFYSKARGYPSCLHRALDAENLPLGVYDNLVKTVNDHVALLHRYVALKKRVLKLDEVHFYDLYVNLVDVPERDYPFEEGRDLVLDGVKPFGPDYVAVMKQAFDSRWIDVYENKGKRSGAYNMGTYLSAPYVLLNYKGKFHDVSTVAHELGHATQSWFASKNQPPIYSGYPMFTAEVASTAAEIVFKKSMLERTKDPKERAFLINQMLEDMRGTIFRQTQFAEFDLAAHTLAEKGEPMTAEVLMKLCHEQYRALLRAGLRHRPGTGCGMPAHPALLPRLLRLPLRRQLLRRRRHRQAHPRQRAGRARAMDEVPQDRQQHVCHRHAQGRRRGHDHPQADRRRHGAV